MVRIYKCLFIYSIIFIYGIDYSFSSVKEHHITPEPVSYQLLKTSFTINKKTVIYCNELNDTDLLLAFSQRLTFAAGFDIAISAHKKTSNVILFEKASSFRSELGEEGYDLRVDRNKISITANTPKGWFYALETLVQLFPLSNGADISRREINLSGVLITDYPRFKYRGLMLDLSRHFFPLPVIKSYINQMSKYKFNVLHLHLTDNQGWRIAINGLPKLTEVGAWRVSRTGYWKGFKAPEPNEVEDYGGFYSYDQIKDLIDYSSKRFVEIIPEVDVPGHSLALIASYPQLSCTQTPQKVLAGDPWNITRTNVLCVGNDSVYVYLDKIFGELASLFPSKYIHIGGDEVTRTFWEKCDKCKNVLKQEGFESTEELQSYFIKKLTSIVESKGKKAIGWYENLKGGLPQSLTVMSWKSDEGGIKASQNNQFAIMTPAAFTYLDFYQGDPYLENGPFSVARLSTMYKFEPLPLKAKEEFILGGQGSLWAEQVPNERKLQYMTWPRAFALSESLWSKKESKNWNSFVVKLEKQLAFLDQSNVKYSTQFYEPIIFSVVEDDLQKVKIITEIEGVDIYYSFDDTSPDLFYPKYTKPLTIPKGAHHIRAVSYRNGKQLGRELNLPLEVVMKRK